MRTLNEISARTLRSYREKAATSKEQLHKEIDSAPSTSYVAQTKGQEAAIKNSKEVIRKSGKWVNRDNGIKKANNRLTIKTVKEDAVPVNNIGSGAIQGAGTGAPDKAEPGVPKKRLKVILNNAKMLTRK